MKGCFCSDDVKEEMSSLRLTLRGVIDLTKDTRGHLFVSIAAKCLASVTDDNDNDVFHLAINRKL